MATQFTQKPLNKAIRFLLGGGALASLLATVPALAQQAPPGERAEEEEVIVLGIRRSLQRSMDLKRDAAQIIDVITAEDMGKLPDENAAAALKRVTGVQIDNRNGIGSSIRVRGMSNVKILLNGSPYTGSGQVGGLRAPVSRNVTLEDIPSDLLSGIEVIKSPTADMESGGLTAVVNLKTKKPLDFDDYFVGGTATNTYSDVAQENAQKYSIYLGKNWNDTVGVLLQVSDNETLVRNDSITYDKWDAIKFLGANPDDMSQSEWLTVTDGDGRSALVLAPQQIRLEQASVFQDKLASNLSLQFRPTDNLEFNIDGFYTEYTETVSRSSLNFGLFDINSQAGIFLDDFEDLTYGTYTPGTAEDAPNIDGEVTLLSGGFAIPSTVAQGDSHVHSGNVGFRDVTNSNLSIGGKWSDDNWTISGNYYHGKSAFDSVWLSQDLKGSYGNINCAWRDPRPLDPFTGQSVECVDNLRFGYNMADGENGNVFIDPSLRGVNPNSYVLADENGNPTSTSVLPDERADGQVLVNTSAYLTDPYSYAVGFTGMFVSEFSTRNDASQIDFERALDWKGMTKVKFGVRHTETENISKNFRGVGEHYRAECTDPSEQLSPRGCADVGALYTTARIGQEDANSLYVQPAERQNIAAVTDGSFMRGVSGSENLQIRQWITGNPAVFSDDPQGRVFSVWGMTPMSDKGIDQSVTETINAAYIRTDFAFLQESVTGNFGIRAVDTQVKAISYRPVQDAVSQILFDDLFRERDYEQLTAERSYTNVLPSLNVNWTFLEGWSLRFAAAKSLAQPDLGALPEGERVTDVSSLRGRVGNPNLQPWKVNQADISLEWYFDESQGGSVSVAGFYKDFTSFITDTEVAFEGENTCRARGVIYEDSSRCIGTKSVNGEGEVLGLEVGYVQPLPLGFGVQANYTYLDSEDTNGLPIPGNSENTYNLIAFYEDFGFSARLAYSWQDSALNTASGFRGAEEYTRARGQLDLALNYDVNDFISLTLSGTNLTQEGEETYSKIEERLMTVQQFDRTVLFSVRGRL